MFSTSQSSKQDGTFLGDLNDTNEPNENIKTEQANLHVNYGAKCIFMLKDILKLYVPH